MSWVVPYKSLKTKETSSWVIPKVVAIAFGSFSSQSLSHHSNGGFIKVAVNRAGCLRSGRKDNFDCMLLMKIRTWGQVGWILTKSFFCVFINREKVEVNKNTNRRSQYPAMWEISSRQDRPGGGGYFLEIGLWGCAAGWGCIFTAGLTIMGLYFH